MELFPMILIVLTAGPILALCVLAFFGGVGLHMLPSFFDPEFYADLFEYISTMDYGEMLEFAKEAIRLHWEMY